MKSGRAEGGGGIGCISWIFVIFRWPGGWRGIDDDGIGIENDEGVFGVDEYSGGGVVDMVER